MPLTSGSAVSTGRYMGDGFFTGGVCGAAATVVPGRLPRLSAPGR
jgi:hypothetical protein